MNASWHGTGVRWLAASGWRAPATQLGGMLTIARFTLLEATRSRLFIAALAAVAGCVGLAAFLGAISITETRQVQASITAALLRITSIAITCLFVISNGWNEQRDKGLELILSLPMPRYAYLFGKLIGFAGVSFCIAVIVALPLFRYAPAVAVCCWMLSLCGEQLLMAAFSLLCLMTFANITLAFVSAMAFYLLSRSMAVLCLLSATPALSSAGRSPDLMAVPINALALLLPDLHAFTRSAWLVYGVDPGAMGAVFVQTLLYLAFLLSVGMFDLCRKNF